MLSIVRYSILTSLSCAVAALLVVLILEAYRRLEAMPVVSLSARTGECIRITMPDGTTAECAAVEGVSRYFVQWEE